MDNMLNQFPAILIGGPPHSGKSVLVYSLTAGLRRINVPHYVLRAAPDGEGDWANESAQSLVRGIRRKGEFSEAFMAQVAHYLRRRHLPLLVDVGGRPTSDQLSIFALCTHAILLVGERQEDLGAYERDRAQWLDFLTRAGLLVIADLRSDLQGQSRLIAAGPPLSGTIAGLERGRSVKGPVIDALLERLAELCGTPATAEAYHLAASPPAVELLHLPELSGQFGEASGHWHPQQLPSLLSSIKPGRSVALYGRGPNWLYAALAIHAAPAKVWLFDVRYGWITPPLLTVGEHDKVQAGWNTSVKHVRIDQAIQLEMISTSQYLDPDKPHKLPLPRLPSRVGVVLSGKIPHWLLMSTARQLSEGRPWLAVYQPQLNGAVIIRNSVQKYNLGQIITI